MASLASFRSGLRASQISRAGAIQRWNFSTSISRRIEAIPLETAAPAEVSLGEASVPRKSPSVDSRQASTSSDSSLSISQATSSQPRPKLKYHIARTPGNNLPIYQDTRNGNTRKETIIRKIFGDAGALRDDIREALKLDEDKVWVGKTTGFVYIKGHHKNPVYTFLTHKGF